MRSIFAKVVIWSLGTVAFSLLAYWLIWRALERRGPGERDLMRHVNAMMEDDLVGAYESGGTARLAEQLRKLDRYLPGEHLLTDERGRDLVSGADRSDLLRRAAPGAGPPRLADGRVVLIPPRHQLRDHRYRFIALVQPWFGPPNILPY